MFESITKKRKNPIINFVGWSLLIIVCVIFVFIGFSPSSQFLGSGGAAAEVNGDAISLREFKDLVDRMGNQNPSSNSDARKRMQASAMNMLIESALITQEAEKLNIYVSDKEVADTLLNIDFFKEDGQFSRLRYKTYLQSARISESEFEDRIRRDLIIQKMTKIIGFTVKDSDMMEKFDKKIDQAKVNVSYLGISANQLANKANLAGAELTKYIEDNKKKVEDYFSTNKNDFREKEQVKARHILVKSKDEKPESMKVAFEKMQKVVKET
ncbi:MAG: SurA N-terminal domain-containing protein, partial [Bdellovibrionales bacterium]|nr:SurA N-terminal domain-containing protein [Bdellovibrionales bacterium]